MMKLFRTKKNAVPEEAGKKPISETRFVVVDSELTGLDENRDSIVSIGAVGMIGGRIVLSDSFYRLINPETSLSSESVVIHEIVPSEVVEKPDIGSVLSEFLKFCGQDVIVGFCLDIDMHFFNRDSRRLFGETIKNRLIDVRDLFEAVMRSRETRGERADMPLRYSIYDVARQFGIEVSGAHNAFHDAFITAQVFQRLLAALVDRRIQTTGDLHNFCRLHKGGDIWRSMRGACNL